MNPGDFVGAAQAVLAELASAVPFPMWVVSRRSGDDYVVLAVHDSQYGIVAGEALPWQRTLCARMVDGSAPCAVGDVAQVPAYAEAAADLRMDIGAYITVPLIGSDGELYGTLCGADPVSHDGALDDELAHVRRAAQVLTVLLEQQLRIEQAQRSSDAWEHEATRDPLTGVGSRRVWDDVLNNVAVQCERLGSRAAVLVVDVDGLKVVNDQLGHAAGDALLRSAGEVLRHQLKAHDVVARTGGDEFGIVLVDVSEQDARRVGERLRTALADVDVDVSVGVCGTRRDLSVSAAWQLADAAMYVDKQSRAATATPRPRRTAAGAAVPAAVAIDGAISALLREVREALDLPVAFVSRFAEGRRIVEALDAACPVPIASGDSHPLEQTYCQRIVDGRLPEAIPDTAENTVAAALPVTQELEIGSYVGVPILLPDASVYGTLCAYAHDARPVDERDTALLHLLARTIGVQLSTRLETWQHESGIRDRIVHVVENDLLESVLQPIVDLTTGDAIGVEALTRFPTTYALRPAEWFADAVEVGEAVTLELAAARKATSALAGLPEHVSLSVNVSAAVAVSPAFLHWLASAPLDRLVLELTEHEQVDDYGALEAALAPARARGLRVAVDDAGAGYASMRHSLLLKPDLLKLDISLVRDVDTDAAKRALCRAVITFAHTTGARVVAEGVETQGELQALRRLGADYGQGYLLQRPVAAPDLRLTALCVNERRRRPAKEQVTAAALEMIEEMRLTGCSDATIAARLNALGEHQPGGFRWHHSAVAAVVR